MLLILKKVSNLSAYFSCGIFYILTFKNDFGFKLAYKYTEKKVIIPEVVLSGAPGIRNVGLKMGEGVRHTDNRLFFTLIANFLE